ncbi:MAG TPA: ATPase domain-containing protein, partial [Nitrososphaerales archaeon]|nr:ATPase domain-containing protein [Nitrososphaerales archaeon]
MINDEWKEVGGRAKNTSTASKSEDGKGGREDRASAGIGGLDRLITGGFLRNSLVLVTGQPGTGKTILTSQFVYHGATHGEKSIYVSYGENKRQFMSNMKQLGMDFAKLEGEQGTFLFMDFASTGSKVGASDSLKLILEQVQRFKAKRLVIDSYNAAMQGFEGSNEARTTLDVVHKVLNEAKCTTLIVSEAPVGMGTNKLSLEEFVADGVIFMDNIFLEVGQIPRRTLSIRKMRGMPIAL